jgi:hypothetical protein
MQVDNHSTASMNFETCDINILDSITLEKIFKQLDAKSLLKVSETCQRFEEVFALSKALMRKVKFKISFPEDEDLRKILKGLLACKEHITRDYLNLHVVRLRDNILNHSEDMRETFLSIISKLATTILNLEINNCYLMRYDVTIMLGQFVNLVEMRLENIMFSDDFMPSEIAQEDKLGERLTCPNLRVLRLVQCDFYCLLLLKCHDKLRTLEISIPSYNRADVQELEDFLLKQTELKELTLVSFRFNSSYSTKRLENVKFQLQSLHLKDVNWDISSHCLAFLKSQTKLQSFSLRRFRSWILPKEANFMWFCSAMHHILISNPITTICIDTTMTSAYMKDCEFLRDSCNNKVTQLTYIRDTKDESELFTIFTRLFPRLKSLKFTDGASDNDSAVLQHLHLYKELTKIMIVAKPQLLDSFCKESVENLTSFKFFATNEDKALERLKQLFAGNTKIESITLEIEPLTIEEITELILNFSSTLRKLRIQDLHLNTTEADMFVNNFKKLRHLCSDVATSQDVLKILNNSHVSFRLSNGSRL